jgi:formate hydrogenlyase subunit 3/multisubunit Na+/H+ antiporter MnhD subunit
MTLFVAVVGWAGAIVILASYVLLSARRLNGHSATYHVMNLLGAVGIAVNSGWNGALPSAVLNVIWAAIAIYAMVGHRGVVQS